MEDIDEYSDKVDDLEEYSSQTDGLEATFSRASGYLQGLAATLSTEKLLYFYARYKQACEGPCNTGKPGFFDFKGKQKWEAWKALGNMTKEDAMTEYVKGISEINLDWQLITPFEGHSRSWVKVSSLAAQAESSKSEEDKDDFDWVKENNVEKLKDVDPEIIMSERDDNGMSLLHWAADRGYEEMTKFLLELGMDVNIQDEEGQTPLHYAASCGHLEVISLLLFEGADTAITDSDGLLAIDCAEDSEVKLLLT